MSVKRCCVPKCTDNEGRSKVLHLFPNPEVEVERFRLWVSIIGGDILGLSNEDIFKHRRVCHSHFEEKYCCRNNRISSIAVPTLLISGPVFWRQLPTKPLCQIQNMPSTSKGNKATVKPDTSVCNIENLDCARDEEVGEVSLPNRTYRRAKTSGKTHNMQISSKGDTANIDNETLVIDTEDIQKPDYPTEKKQGPGAKLKKQKRVNTVKMTTNEKKIYQKLLATRTKLSKIRSKVKKQTSELTIAQNFLKNPKFQNVINNLSTSSRTLTLLQFSRM